MSSPTKLQGSMELKAAQVDLQAEAHCPICKEDFKNRVTIGCRHDFCHACISEFWKDRKGSFPCPVCHFNCPEGKFWSHEHLSQATEVSQPLPVKKIRNSPQGTCSSEMRPQPPAPCSGKDQEVFSPSPTSHFVWPIEDAALCTREQIEFYIKMWREKVEPAEKAIATQRRRSLELKRRVHLRREEVMSEYQQYMLILQNEEKSILEQLENEKVIALAKMNKNLENFSEHMSSLKCLLMEVEKKCAKSELELLASVKDVYKRNKNLECPRIVFFELKVRSLVLPPQYSGLDRIIKQFHVDVTLDPETAHCRLDVSEDKKAVLYGQMKELPNNQRRFHMYPIVLGSEGYSSGRQYWEVAVEHMCDWFLGVCKEPFPRSMDRSKNEQQPFSLQDGLWGVGLTSCQDYIGLGLKKIDLLPKVAPNRVGIFLDSDLHEVSFYNLSDKSLLCHFSDCASGALWPYFYTGYASVPLKICTAEDPEW
ncbi:tripartite motif-containing protein 60 [Cricetulus griseus]|uniref:Tripartite motif-containing protein 60 n=1 Tax=Cricetulus griseus TaxID=10029 RepID=G3H6P5_CRIGR|nr:tripartite motif-containing protein 60 [Cricetulus griseus]XP_027249852.1 tripartite motif-containing protein 60 [Cricetulus griseus]EGV92633.1 Tripartite motif-containing protein 60 [Cricetulus griseus]ERE92339.1 tripartite motif-containing protein 60 [Cricetulus griseus]